MKADNEVETDVKTRFADVEGIDAARQNSKRSSISSKSRQVFNMGAKFRGVVFSPVHQDVANCSRRPSRVNRTCRSFRVRDRRSWRCSSVWALNARGTCSRRLACNRALCLSTRSTPSVKRSARVWRATMSEQTINQLLVEMDGFSDETQSSFSRRRTALTCWTRP